MSTLASIWFPHMLVALCQTTVAAAIILVLARVARVAREPRLRHAIVVVGLAKFVLPPMLPLPTGIFSLAPPLPEIGRVRSVLSTAAAMPAVVTALMFIHLAGIAVALVRLALETRRISAAAANGVKLGGSGLLGMARKISGRRNVRLLVTRDLVVPVSAGVWRPVVLIPVDLVATLTPEALRDVIAHEAEHIRRRDVAMNWAQALLGAFWWFDPAYHLLSRAARAAREECCDDAVLARRPAEGAAYARALLETAAHLSGRAPMTAAGIADTQHSLVRRVARLAEPGFAPARRVGPAGLLLVATLMATILPGLRVSRDNRVAFDRGTMRALHIHRQ